MLKYLEKIREILAGLKHGVESHTAEWLGQFETPAVIQSKIVQIDTIQDEIKTLKDQLSQKKKQARKLQKELGIFTDTIKNKAIGFHLSKPELLKDYDIKLRREYQKTVKPSAILAVTISDAPSGKGFVVSTNRDPLSSHYEWQRGIGENPRDVVNIPPMHFYKSTSKSQFTDEDIEIGVRYFYRVRPANRSGEGPWSATVSRVQ
jgi:hypothetical protein